MICSQTPDHHIVPLLEGGIVISGILLAGTVLVIDMYAVILGDGRFEIILAYRFLNNKFRDYQTHMQLILCIAIVIFPK